MVLSSFITVILTCLLSFSSLTYGMEGKEEEKERVFNVNVGDHIDEGTIKALKDFPKTNSLKLAGSTRVNNWTPLTDLAYLQKLEIWALSPDSRASFFEALHRFQALKE